MDDFERLRGRLFGIAYLAKAVTKLSIKQLTSARTSSPCEDAVVTDRRAAGSELVNRRDTT